MGNYCPKCRMWVPDDLKECPACHGLPERKRSPMEKIFIVILAFAIIILAMGVIMPRQVFDFIQRIDVEFVQITNGSDGLLAKLGLDDPHRFTRWEDNLTEILLGGINSSRVQSILKARAKEGEYLRNIDVLANYVTANIRYKEKRDYTDLDTILSKFSGDDRAQVMLLASLFNGSSIDFRIDLVEEETKKGRGYHFRMLVGVTLPEEEVKSRVVKRIRNKRSGLMGTRAKVWYIQDEDRRWYVIDTTGQTKKKTGAFVDTSWIYIGSSHQYYTNRSHISLELPLG